MLKLNLIAAPFVPVVVPSLSSAVLEPLNVFEAKACTAQYGTIINPFLRYALCWHTPQRCVCEGVGGLLVDLLLYRCISWTE